MAVEMFCIGCGEDISSNSKNRRSLSPDAPGAIEPRKEVVSSWMSLVSKQLLLQDLSIEETTIDAADPGKICKPCFAAFQRYHKLQVQLEKKLAVVLQKMRLVQAAHPDPVSATPPPSKRRCMADRRTSVTALSFPSGSPPVSINIGYESAPKQYNLYTPRRRHNIMGKAIARGSKKALLDQCYEDPESRALFMKKIERILKSEMKVLCKVETGSILRNRSYDSMKEFKWEPLVEEVKMHVPLLHNILNACTSTKYGRSNRNATIGIKFVLPFCYVIDACG